MKFKTKNKSWKSPHRSLGSSWAGDKLAASNYGKRQRKSQSSLPIGWKFTENGVAVTKKDGTVVEYRGMNHISFVSARDCPERLGKPLPRIPKYVEAFYKKNRFSMPKDFVRGL